MQPPWLTRSPIKAGAPSQSGEGACLRLVSALVPAQPWRPLSRSAQRHLRRAAVRATRATQMRDGA
eukprot:2108956-Pleurochrysis_carterae.AAC.1